MRKVLFYLFASAVAIAGAAPVVYASEYDLENNESFFEENPDDLDSDLDSFEENNVQDLQSDMISPTPNIASESEILGEFGNDDNSVNDALQDLFNDVSDSGFDFISSPSPDEEEGSIFPTPSFSPLFENQDSDIDLYANYNSYYGSIGSTYLEYMRGFLPKLGFREHYVASRTGQYDYIFAFGEDLSFNGSYFVGTGITVIHWNTYNNGSYYSGFESSFTLYPGSYLVYSDLSKVFPSLADSAGFTLRQILILLTAFILGLVIDHMYQVRKIRRLNKL